MKKLITSIVLMLSTTAVLAQHSGNIVYSNNLPKHISQTQDRPTEKLFLTDSAFIVDVKIQMNVIADSYVVTFGVADSATTIRLANERIDKRIGFFVNALAKAGINSKDIHIDMISQGKMLDYTIKGRVAQQFIQGFEIKKNVMIAITNVKDIDKLMLLAADQQIYDLIKVDYIIEDINKVNSGLFKSAMEVINQKKEMYVTATNVTLMPSSQVYSSKTYSFCQPNYITVTVQTPAAKFIIMV